MGFACGRSDLFLDVDWRCFWYDLSGKARKIDLNSLKWKREISKFYLPLSIVKKSRKIILIYHAVGAGPWAVSEDVFRQQMHWLTIHCKIVSLTDLLTQSSNANQIQVALTFDDGYACLYDTVLPILQSINAVATVYINTGWMSDCDKTRKKSNSDLGHYFGEKFLTWNEVIALDQAGWEIGSHGVNHIDLTQCDAEINRNELLNSKSAIQNILKKECQHFAYTWGRHSKYLRKEVYNAGYRYAVAAHHKALKNDDKMALPRLNIDRHYSHEDFKKIIFGKWDFLNFIQKIKKIL